MMKNTAVRLALGLITLLLFACVQKPPANRYGNDKNRPLVDGKYSLAADREKLDELRKDVPADIKNKNDQEALVKFLTAEVKRPPADIRSVFNEMVQKKRQDFDRDMTKEREKFNQDEKTRRSGFLDRQSDARNSFNRSKSTKPVRDSFFAEQDSARKNFFADEREKRNDFESQVRERRKNFEDHIRSKTNEFTQEMRIYQKKYDDMKKAEADAQREAEKKAEGNPQAGEPGH